jgi:hypothetical protein
MFRIATPMLPHQFMKKDEKTDIATSHIFHGIVMDEMLKLKLWWTVEGRLFSDNEALVMMCGFYITICPQLELAILQIPSNHHSFLKPCAIAEAHLDYCFCSRLE